MNDAEVSRELWRAAPVALSGLGSFLPVFLTWTLTLWAGGYYQGMPGVVGVLLVVLDFVVVLALLLVGVRLLVLRRRRFQGMVLLLGTVLGWLAFGCYAVWYGSAID
jgi:hypothetical protein